MSGTPEVEPRQAGTGGGRLRIPSADETALRSRRWIHLVRLTHRVLTIAAAICLLIAIIAVLALLEGGARDDPLRGYLLTAAAGAGIMGVALSLIAIPLGRLTPRPPKPQDMPPVVLDHALERAHIAEQPPAGSDNLFSEPVLLVSNRRIYDRQGRLRATLTKAPHNLPFRKHLFSGAPVISEVVDTDGRVLLELRSHGHEAEPVRHGRKRHRPETFRAVANDGDEIGTVIVLLGNIRRMPILSSGELIGFLCRDKRFGRFSLRDPNDVEIGSVTHVKPRLTWAFHADRGECNVLEVADGMPGRLRPLVLAASEVVSALKAPH